MMRLVILHPSLQMLLIFSLLLNPRPRRVLSSFPSHISSGACLGSSSPSCTILNSSFCGEEPDDNNNADLRLIRRLSSDLKIDILSRIIHKLKLRPLRRILLQNSVYHDRNGSLSYLRRELKKYITRLKQGKRTEERRSKELKLENDQKRNQQLNWSKLGLNWLTRISMSM